ncbi:MAG: hypothetical protein EB100_07015, partial [Crocinitomicaceae bacterium]|nr:hypothetical protein [Crocinitomicaceae bacterium]
ITTIFSKIPLMKYTLMIKILKFSLLLIGFAFIINSCKKAETEVTFDENLLIGKWVTGKTIFYKYTSDHNGLTWDTSDDVTEAEAQKFTWNLNKAVLTQTHIMEVGGNVPKVYTITTLNSTNLVYKDDFGNVTTFTKVP